MAEPLHIEMQGQGPDLVLLHGWAMHGGIWPQVMIDKLAESYRVHKVDLPGHGLSRPIEKPFTVESVTSTLEQNLLPQLTDHAIFVGWSLGGLIAANLALKDKLGNKTRIDRLVIIASSLRFTKTDNWPHAVESKVLQLFADSLMEDYRGTLSRFLALQFNGDNHAREGLRELKQKVFAREVPPPDILKQGLDMLLQADLREPAKALDCPVQFIGGEHDTLVPAQALAHIAGDIAQAEVAIIKGAGHAPFISHPHEFYKVLAGFLHA